MADLLKNDVLGRVITHSATIEWQKRGLTHVHILLIMENKDKPRLPEDIDNVVSAELPDPSANPKLYDTVVQTMMHGPCGILNPLSVCMEASGGQSTCSKNFKSDFAKKRFSGKMEFLSTNEGRLKTVVIQLPKQLKATL